MENIKSQRDTIRATESDVDKPGKCEEDQKVQAFVDSFSIIEKTAAVDETIKHHDTLWIPKPLGPGISKVDEKPVKNARPVCYGGHNVSFKKLILVNWVRSCGCSKEFKNGMDIFIHAPCGHAMCGSCRKLQDKKCTVCSLPASVVKLCQDGTGFSTAGKAIAQTFTEAFQ